MQRVKCDVVIRFDEATGNMVVQAVASERLDEFFQQPHAAWAAGVAELRSLGHERAENLVGRKVLRELDRYSPVGLELCDFEALEREDLRITLEALEQRATLGEAEAQVEAFRALWNQALKTASPVLLERAENYLNAASAQNYAPALELSAVWPKIKAQAQATISKRGP